MHKKIRIFVFFSCFVWVTSVCGQVQIGVKGGLSLPNLAPASNSSDVSRGYKTISGPDYSLVVDFPLSGKFSLETGIEWATEGGQKSGLQTIPASPELEPYFPPGSNTRYLYANFTSTVRLQYLMLPVLLKYTMDIGSSGRWKIYIDGGIFGGLLVTAKGSASGTSKVYFDKQQTQPVSSTPVTFDSTGDIKNQLHKGNFGIAGNAGLLYSAEKISLFLEGGGNYGFIDLQKNSENGINHTGAFLFRIGLYYPLRKQ